MKRDQDEESIDIVDDETDNSIRSTKDEWDQVIFEFYF